MFSLIDVNFFNITYQTMREGNDLSFLKEVNFVKEYLY